MVSEVSHHNTFNQVLFYHTFLIFYQISYSVLFTVYKLYINFGKTSNNLLGELYLPKDIVVLKNIKWFDRMQSNHITLLIMSKMLATEKNKDER